MFGTLLLRKVWKMASTPKLISNPLKRKFEKPRAIFELSGKVTLLVKKSKYDNGKNYCTFVRSTGSYVASIDIGYGAMLVFSDNLAKIQSDMESGKADECDIVNLNERQTIRVEYFDQTGQNYVCLCSWPSAVSINIIVIIILISQNIK